MMVRLPAQVLRRAILHMKASADAESYGYSDEYYELLRVYHEQVDASWMPEGYGMATRDPSILWVVDMNQIPMLESQPSKLYELVRQLRDSDEEATFVWP